MSFDPSALIQWAFFSILFDLVDGEISSFQGTMLKNTMSWISGTALTLVTLWVLIQGYTIITGRSRESLMSLVVNSLRAFLIVIAATTMSFAGVNITHQLTTAMPEQIHKVVTGDDGDVADEIDKNLKIMGLIFALVDSLPSEQADGENSDGKKSVTNMTLVGIAGPSVVGGAMLLLYKIALVLFVGLGPLFILSLLFEQTKDLFKRWLMYGLGTMFSMAVLSFMVSLSTKIVAYVAAAMVLAYKLTSGGALADFTGGLNSAAIQQGGIGLLMSVLMVMAPPMAAMFFNGTLGQFVANSSFGNVGRNSTGQKSDISQGTYATNPMQQPQPTPSTGAVGARPTP